MFKPLVIAFPYLFERSATGQVLRTFWEGISSVNFSPTILCSDAENNVDFSRLKCNILKTPDCQIIRYFIAFLKRIVASDFAFLPDYAFFSWAKFSAISRSLKMMKDEQFDYIHSFSYPCSSHLIAAKVKKKKNLPWVASFYDPWYGNPYRKFKFKWSNELNRKMENIVAENADMIIHTNEAIYNEWVSRYGDSIKEKMFVLPLVFSIPQDTDKSTEFQHDKFIISHIGSLYEGRTATDFLLAINLLLSKHPEIKNRVQINFVGTILESDKKYAELLGLKDIIYYSGVVSEKDCLKFFEESDLFVAIDGERGRDIFFPSKIMKYFYYGKPILGLSPKNSVLDKELLKSGNYCFRNKDIDSISSFIYKAVTDYNSIKTNDKLYWKNFTVDIVEQRYLMLISQLLTNK